MPDPVAIFLSRPTWVPPECSAGLEAFTGLLVTLDLTPRTLGVSDYPSKAPLDHVIELLRTCAGAIILGIPQIVVNDGSLKGEPLEPGISLATEWNHIEGGLAYALGIPLLVIHDNTVRRGIFDRGASNTFLYSTDFANSSWPLHPDIAGGLKRWREDVLRGHVASRLGNTVESSDPPCPNCSAGGKVIYMSRLPDAFQRDMQATHHCTQCDYMTSVEGAS